jgi:hypothetical protein
MPHLGSARPTLRALSIWPSEGGPVRRLRSPSSADKDTNACTTWLSMRRSGFSRNPSRTQPGKRSSVSSTGRMLWLGSRKTGLTLWQESRAKAGVSAEEACLHKRVEKLGDVQSVSDQDRDPIRESHRSMSWNIVDLARPKRFELLTPRFVVWCSIQLSYGRVFRLAFGLKGPGCVRTRSGRSRKSALATRSGLAWQGGESGICLSFCDSESAGAAAKSASF